MTNELLARVVAALTELTAVVRGECPSLFNEDSGGNAKLSIEIDEVLRLAATQAGAEVGVNALSSFLLDAPAQSATAMAHALLAKYDIFEKVEG